MTQLLKDYLTVALSDSKTAARRLAEKPYIRKLGYLDENGKVKPVRELLLTGDLSGSNLIQTEVKATVVEGAQPARAFMDVLPIDRTPGTTFKWPYGASGVYAEKYPQGAEIQVKTQDYSAASYDASEVIAHRPLISDTMIESGQVDIIEQEISYAGAAVMNKAERICLSEILQDSGQVFDTAGANQGLKAGSRPSPSQGATTWPPTWSSCTPTPKDLVCRTWSFRPRPVRTPSPGARASPTGTWG